MAAQQPTASPGLLVTTRDYKTTLRHVLKIAYLGIKHTVRAIGWASHIWFNVALPLSILLAGIAIMAGLVFLGLAILAPDSVQSVADFRFWVYPAD